MIVEPDESYLSALEYKFAEEWEDFVEIEAISSLKYLNEYFEEPRNLYILLINEYLYSEKIAMHDCVHTFLLTEDEKKLPDQKNAHAIYKYTGVAEIYGRVNRVVQAWKERERGSATQLTVVTSVTGGCGKTLFSLGIAAELAARERNVLYLSAELLQDFQVYLEEEKTIPDAFCHALAMREGHIAAMTEKCVGREEFSWLLPFRHTASSYQITLADYVYLIDALLKAGLWQEIVLELPLEMGSDMAILLQKAHHVVVLCRQDASSALRLQRFTESIAVQDDKYLFVCNRYQAEQDNQLMQKDCVEIAEYIEEFDGELTLEQVRKKGLLRNIVYMLD